MIKTRICTQCDKEFTPEYPQSKVCSEACKIQRKKEYLKKYYKDKKATLLPINCAFCEAEFVPLKANVKFCSEECRIASDKRKRANYWQEYYNENKEKILTKNKKWMKDNYQKKELPIKKCEVCKEEFRPNHNNEKFCSSDCKDKHAKIYYKTNEYKEKINKQRSLRYLNDEKYREKRKEIVKTYKKRKKEKESEENRLQRLEQERIRQKNYQESKRKKDFKLTVFTTEEKQAVLWARRNYGPKWIEKHFSKTFEEHMATMPTGASIEVWKVVYFDPFGCADWNEYTHILRRLQAKGILAEVNDQLLKKWGGWKIEN
jgi:hypothetical protein